MRQNLFIFLIGLRVFFKSGEGQIPDLPDGFKVMFAGNVGEAQDFDNIMQAALRLKEYKDIHLL